MRRREPLLWRFKSRPMSHVFRIFRSDVKYRHACWMLPRKWWHQQCIELGTPRPYCEGYPLAISWYSVWYNQNIEYRSEFPYSDIFVHREFCKRIEEAIGVLCFVCQQPTREWGEFRTDDKPWNAAGCRECLRLAHRKRSVVQAQIETLQRLAKELA